MTIQIIEGCVKITYENGITAEIRQCIVTGYCDLDLFLGSRKINKEMYELVYGERAGEMPFGFANCSAEKLTNILNFVSNLTIKQGGE